MQFKDLSPGDMFNTKAARWVKIDRHTAIVVMSGILEIGLFQEITDDVNIIPLYIRNDLEI